MAAALITISGTSGKVLVRYKIGSVQHNLETDIGTLYIEDTATDVTYTTLTGDAIASSTVFTIAALPYIYYNLFWKGIESEGYSFVSFTNDGVTTPIPSNIPFPNPRVTLANVINSLDIDSFKIVKYKSAITDFNSTTGEATVSNSYIIRATSPIIEFKIKNADNTGFIYLKPEPTTLGSLTGYTDIDVCVSEPTSYPS